MSNDKRGNGEKKNEGNSRKDILSRLSDFNTLGRSPKRKWSVMGRRGVLKRLAALGVSGSTLQALSQSAQAATNDPGSEVPYVAGYRVSDADALRRDPTGADIEMEPVVKTVSRERWNRVKTAHKASREVVHQIINRFDAPFVSAGVTTDDMGQKEVLVTRRRPEGVETTDHPTDLETIREELPQTTSATVGKGPDATTMTNIPVRVSDWSLQNNSYDEEYRPIPGGCKFQVGSDDDSDYAPYGTFTQPVYSESRGQYEMLTAGHNVEKRVGNDVWQPGADCGWVGCNPADGSVASYEFDSYTINIDVDGDGDPDDVLKTFVDAGTCEMDDPLTYGLADPFDDETRADITGFWTWDEIEMAEDDGTYIGFQGYVSGQKGGQIMYTDSYRNWFVQDATSQNGDSGAPFYHTEAYQEVSTIGVLSAGVDIDGDGNYDDAVSGNSLGRIFDDLNLRFN